MYIIKPIHSYSFLHSLRIALQTYLHLLIMTISFPFEVSIKVTFNGLRLYENVLKKNAFENFLIGCLFFVGLRLILEAERKLLLMSPQWLPRRQSAFCSIQCCFKQFPI